MINGNTWIDLIGENITLYLTFPDHGSTLSKIKIDFLYVQQYDMEAPLAHYFLYTGHNSYLTGNQLSSDSSVDPIIQALRHGVRVIELDLWPNSKKTNDVKVCHGGYEMN